MPKNESEKPDFDWAVTTFEGSRREQLRRWAKLPLENILLAIEEMQDLAYLFGTASRGEYGESVRGASDTEPPVGYGKSGADHDVELPGYTPEPRETTNKQASASEPPDKPRAAIQDEAGREDVGQAGGRREGLKVNGEKTPKTF